MTNQEKFQKAYIVFFANESYEPINVDCVYLDDEIYIMLATGVDSGESYQLTIDDIDFENDKLYQLTLME